MVKGTGQDDITISMGVLGDTQTQFDTAIKGLQNLQKSISKLQEITDATSLSVKGIKNSFDALKSVKLPNGFDAFITNMREFSKLNANRINAVAGGLNNLSSIGKLPNIPEKFIDSIKAISSVEITKAKATNLSDFMNSIAALGAVQRMPNLTAMISSLQTLATIQLPSLTPIVAELQKLTAAFSSTASAATGLNSALPNVNANLGALSNNLNVASQTAQSTASGLGSSTNTVREHATVWEHLGHRIKQYMEYRVISTVIIAIQEALSQVIPTIADYDQSLKDLQAITQSSAGDMEKMGVAIRQVSSKTKFSSSEVAAGAKLLAQAGLNASDTILALQAVSDLATGTLTDMSTAVDLVTTAIFTFGGGAKEAAHYADVMTNAANLSKLDMDKLRTGMNYVGPVAADLGLTFSETAAAMTVLSNAGLRASTMGTSLREVLGEIASPSEKFQAAIKAAGMTMADLDPATHNFSQILSSLRVVVTDTGKAFELFGKRGASGALALLNTVGANGYDAMLQRVDQFGSAARAAQIQMEGLENQWKNLVAVAGNFAIQLGEAGLIGVLTSIISVLKDFIDGLSFLVNNPGVKFLAWATAATVGIRLLVTVFTGWPTVLANAILSVTNFSTVVATAHPGVIALTAAIRQFGAAAVLADVGLLPLIGTIGIVVAAIIGVIAVTSTWEKSTKELQKQFLETKANIDKSKDAVVGFSAELGNISQVGGPEMINFMERLSAQFPEITNEIYATGGSIEKLNEVIKNFNATLKDKEIENYKVGLKATTKDMKDLINTQMSLQLEKKHGNPGLIDTSITSVSRNVDAELQKNSNALMVKMQENAQKLLDIAEKQGIDLASISDKQREELFASVGMDIKNFGAANRQYAEEVQKTFLGIALKIKEGREAVDASYGKGDAKVISLWAKALNDGTDVLSGMLYSRNREVASHVSGLTELLDKVDKEQIAKYLEGRENLVAAYEGENSRYNSIQNKTAEDVAKHNDVMFDLGKQALDLEKKLREDKATNMAIGIQQLTDNMAAEIKKTKDLHKPLADEEKIIKEIGLRFKTSLAKFLTIGFDPEATFKEMQQQNQNLENDSKMKSERIAAMVAADGDARFTQFTELADADATMYDKMLENAKKFLDDINALPYFKDKEKLVNNTEDMINATGLKAIQARRAANKSTAEDERRSLLENYNFVKDTNDKIKRDSEDTLERDVYLTGISAEKKTERLKEIQLKYLRSQADAAKNNLDATSRLFAPESDDVKKAQDTYNTALNTLNTYLTQQRSANTDALQSTVDKQNETNRDIETANKEHYRKMLEDQTKANQDMEKAERDYQEKLKQINIDDNKRTASIDVDRTVKLQQLAAERLRILQKGQSAEMQLMDNTANRSFEIQRKGLSDFSQSTALKIQAETQLKNAKDTMEVASREKDMEALKRAETFASQAASIAQSIPESADSEAIVKKVQDFQKESISIRVELEQWAHDKKVKDAESGFEFEKLKAQQLHQDALYNALKEKINKLTDIEETYEAQRLAEEASHLQKMNNLKVQAAAQGKKLEGLQEQGKILNEGQEGKLPKPTVDTSTVVADIKVTPAAKEKAEQELVPSPTSTRLQKLREEISTLNRERLLLEDERNKVAARIDEARAKGAEADKVDIKKYEELTGKLIKNSKDAQANLEQQASGFDKLARKLTSNAEEIPKIANSLEQAGVNGLSTFFSDIIIEGKNAEDSLKSFGATFAKTVANVILQILALRAVKAIGGYLGGAFSEGGLVGGSDAKAPIKKADGGYISGPGSGTSDSILAKLSNGEYVMTAKQTAQWLPVLEIMRRGEFGSWLAGKQYNSVTPRIPSVGKYADGGLVRSQPKTTDKNSGTNNVNMVFNVSDSGSSNVSTESSGSNNNIKLLGKMLSNMVTAQLEKEKRPGGLLYGS